jgi:tetratricopeptide (TPR) repeat protein
MLKHALPLDDGTDRGSDLTGSIFGNFGSFLSGGSVGGKSVLLSGNDYFTLRQHYIKMANDFIAKGNYKDAAYVYMKLLKDYASAARTLSDGKMYKEAASIYLKYLDNKQSAAECYILAKMYKEAIALYVEINDFEKAADLCLEINQSEKAKFYYGKVIEDYVSKNQYLKASFIYKNKLNNLEACQGLLWDGFLNNNDAFNCLNNYLNNIPSEEDVMNKIAKVANEHIDAGNASTFMQALHHELNRFPSRTQFLKSIAQEVISKYAHKDKNLINFIQDYYNQKSEIRKDISLFRMKR